MAPDVRFEEFEREIMDRYRIEFPLIQYEDDRGEKITIDCEYSFDQAIKLANGLSMDRKYDQVYLDIFCGEKPGYVFK